MTRTNQRDEPTAPRVDLSEWLGITELAAELGIPKRTLYAWRSQGKAPLGAVFGKHVRFRRGDVEAWIAEHVDQPRPSVGGGPDAPAA